MARKKELVAYCGLYCGDCVKFKGNISKLASELKNELKKENFDKIAPTLHGIENYNDFINMLSTLTELGCEVGCRDGGGTPECEIKICCLDKGFETCAECDKFQICPELAGVPMIQCGVVSYVKELERIRDVGLEKWLSEKE
jgi:hypothetical protein